MRAATFLLASVVGLAACTDVRDFAGGWTGERVGSGPPLAIGDGVSATVTIEAIDKHGLRGAVRVLDDAGGIVIDSDYASLESAEADALASLTFSGAPVRVYLAFVPMSTSPTRDVLAVISLYDSRRIELRLIKGEPQPLYAIYALHEID